MAAEASPPLPTDLLPAVGYIRVSMAREEMISPELQRTAIEKKAHGDGAYIAEWIEELDISGRGFGRKGVQRAIELVSGGTVRRVYVWKYSRFGRNAVGVGMNVEKMEEAGGRLALVSATEHVDASTAVGKFTRGMLWQIDEFQSNVIGEQFKETHARRHRNGLPHSGGARFGYLYHRPTIRTLAYTINCPQGCGPGECEAGYVPDPATRDVVAGMYAAYNSGLSVLKISVDLNGRGFTHTTGRPWNQRNVRRFMDTGFAAGRLRVHDPACDCGQAATCQNKILIPGAHPQILAAGDEEAEEIWQEYLRQRERRAYLPPRVETPSYPLAGLVRCGRCKGPMNAHSHVDKQGVKHPGWMYDCALYKRSRECEGSWMARHRVEDVVLAWLDMLAGDTVWRGEVERKISAVRDQGAVRRRLIREAEQLEEALGRITVQFGMGTVTDDAYKAAERQITGRRAEIGTALEKLVPEPVAATPPFEVAAALADKWLTLPVTVKRPMLGQLIDHMELLSHGRGRGSVSIASQWGDVYLYDI
jgi:DNA invertase Pin-like site-specific DNA recombinase